MYHDIVNVLKKDGELVLVTLAAVKGSSPQSVQSKLIVRPGEAKTIGTIGGGCMEAEMILQGRMLLDNPDWKILQYQLDESNTDHGLICGGVVRILLEHLDVSALPVFRHILDREKKSINSYLLHTCTKGEKGTVALFDENGDLIHQGKLPEGVPEHIRIIEKAELHEESDTLTFVEKIPARPGLYLFGGGHVSKYAGKFAADTGFRVTILDDRPQYANPKRFPEVDKTRVIDFTRSFESLSPSANDYIVIITRGHQYDEEVLEQALQTPAKYVGMIGSKRKVHTIFERLRERGVPEERFERVYAPLGLDIRAVTPQEIGISIVSELIKVKNGDPTAPAVHMASRKGRLKDIP